MENHFQLGTYQELGEESKYSIHVDPYAHVVSWMGTDGGKEMGSLPHSPSPNE